MIATLYGGPHDGHELQVPDDVVTIHVPVRCHPSSDVLFSEMQSETCIYDRQEDSPIFEYSRTEQP